ncbi:DNA ligase [Streptomyces sp. M41(2017)]|uniref:ATP-dependent DNA ligase n=1 Tax=Streptomyces sp. M41(2017) TaxID=1955065 RepID=UPI0009BD9414|nr:DNA ligase [Streptomyces sp. M41(2017)]OQQ12942.1 DNA ligase [Streptomyces sp. M41(2017)]OQQ15497.1 DNA ligase [Streptomyces sp. M41(2017)]
MDFPVDVALAEAVPRLPTGDGWWYEVKFDGHRAVIWREAETVRAQARSGRDVTRAWMDLAVAALHTLRPGTVLDGEAVIYKGGRVDFSAAQSRAASSPSRARQLAAEWPATFAAWDILRHPDHGDVRGRPYTERRGLLLDLLEDVPPPIQVVPATDDPTVAQAWYETLHDVGIEGIVAKRAGSPYRAGRIWQKIRHADTVDARVIGHTGPAARPRALVVELPDTRHRLSQALTAPLAAAVAAHIATSGPGRRNRTRDLGSYTTVAPGLTVEVLAGTTRHGVVTVTRVR